MTWAMMPERYQLPNNQVRLQLCGSNIIQFYASQHFLDPKNPTQSELQFYIYSRQFISYGLAAPNNGDSKYTPIYKNIYKEPMWEDSELTILWEDDPKLDLLKYKMNFRANFIPIGSTPKERLRTIKLDPNFPSIVNFLCNPLEKPEKSSSYDTRLKGPLRLRLLPVVYCPNQKMGETPPEMAYIINKYGAAFLIQNLPYNPGSAGQLVRPMTDTTVKVKLYSDIKNLKAYPPLPPKPTPPPTPPPQKSRTLKTSYCGGIGYVTYHPRGFLNKQYPEIIGYAMCRGMRHECPIVDFDTLGGASKLVGIFNCVWTRGGTPENPSLSLMARSR